MSHQIVKMEAELVLRMGFSGDVFEAVLANQTNTLQIDLRPLSVTE